MEKSAICKFILKSSFNFLIHIPLLPVVVENKAMIFGYTIGVILQILQTVGMKHILGNQYKGFDKQQLLSIGSISNWYFMNMFPLYGDQAENISVLI